MTSMDELLAGLPKGRKKRRIHQRHKLAIAAGSVKSEINVTPLVDVVLVLLIIFMVVTPMITRGMPVEMPITEHHDKKNDSGEQIVVSVACLTYKMGPKRRECEKSQIYVATDRVEGRQGLIDRIQQEMRKSPGREVHIKGDKSLNYGAVREAMEWVHDAGVPAVALGSKEKEE